MIAQWKVNPWKILSGSEIREVLMELKRKSKRSINTRANLIVFRLATCCGLRVSEISGLRMRDVKLNEKKPHIRLPKTLTKRKKERRVPLWWDAGTLADIEAWKAERKLQGAKAGDFFMCSQHTDTFGKQLDRFNIRHRFKVSCKTLGPERTERLTIHDGRHSFISHALAKSRTLAEVKDAAGHANISTTSGYLHIAVDDNGTIGNIFEQE
ncbi:MAG: tyrosine-type recombinase/integrase [Planctomycetota bacterium]|jgi:integrase